MCNITSSGHKNYPLDKANQCDHPLFPWDLKEKLFFFILFLERLWDHIKSYFVDSVLDILVICSRWHPRVNDLCGISQTHMMLTKEKFAYMLINCNHNRIETTSTSNPLLSYPTTVWSGNLACPARPADPIRLHLGSSYSTALKFEAQT